MDRRQLLIGGLSAAFGATGAVVTSALVLGPKEAIISEPEIITPPVDPFNIPLPMPEPLIFDELDKVDPKSARWRPETPYIDPTIEKVFPMPRLLRSASQIVFFNTHTSEKLKVDFRNIDKEAFNHFMRDFRRNEEIDIDDRLIRKFGRVVKKLRDGGAEVDSMDLISGYRSAATNAKLQKERGGQATNSQHIKGRAMDIRASGVELSALHKAAKTVAKSDGAGGVGYYQASNFVHIDVARLRFWS